MKKKIITQDDIAKALNISRITVSKALNGKGYVSDQTKKDVLQVANELGYFSNQSKKDSIDQNAPYTIALLISKESFVIPYWNQLISSINDYFYLNNIRLNFSLFSNDDQINLVVPPTLSHPKPDGMIVLGYIKDNYFKALIQTNIPLVSFDIPLSFYKCDLNFDTVTLENELAIDEITTKLISMGHKSIAVLGYKNQCLSFYERYLGYVHAMLRNNLQPIDVLANIPLFTPDSENSHRVLIDTIKKMHVTPTAIICCNDSLAEICIQMKKQMKPALDDLVITGFDNSDYLNLQKNELAATVETFLPNVGDVLAERIVCRIKNPELFYTNIKLHCKPIYHF